jgi:hypothetical protein
MSKATVTLAEGGRQGHLVALQQPDGTGILSQWLPSRLAR